MTEISFGSKEARLFLWFYPRHTKDLILLNDTHISKLGAALKASVMFIMSKKFVGIFVDLRFRFYLVPTTTNMLTLTTLYSNYIEREDEIVIHHDELMERSKNSLFASYLLIIFKGWRQMFQMPSRSMIGRHNLHKEETWLQCY